MQSKIAVKELAYFVCQSGDLTTEFFSSYDDSKGTLAHRYLQGNYESTDKKEVYIKNIISYKNNEYTLHGFIDGVLNRDSEIIIEEIKSTNNDLDILSLDYHKEYLAQLKIYGYLYALNNKMDKIHLRLTFISIIDYETKSFDLIENIDDLEDFTLNLLEEYLMWIDITKNHEKRKEETIKTIKFPFKSERKGQRDLMAATFKALKNNEILYTIAPTGIGKTMATLFSALKTLKKQDKLFYTTAKTSGKNAPLLAIKLLEEKGLSIKTVDITAKKKICNRKVDHCNPDDCPFAKGYFDRLKGATLEIFKYNDVFDYDLITKVCDKYQICAFEFQLYISYFCDLVICDYNYVFDPKVHLIRYFDDDTYKPKVLVDEAHNLIERSKEMYSASINESNLRTLRKLLNGYKPSVRSDINKAIEIISSYRDKLALKALYVSLEYDRELNNIIESIIRKVDQVLEENTKIKDKDLILENYYQLLDFKDCSELFSKTHRMYAKIVKDEVEIDYFCLDASEFILKTIEESIHGIVFFSATLYPIEYHTNLITNGHGKYLELESPFDPNNLDIIINNEISTKYKDRENSVDSIIEAIESLTSVKSGNYICFFPSYQYLKMVTSVIDNPSYEMIIQESNMTDQEKNEVINKFMSSTKTKVGFFVMGGAFSEGIDYIGDALSGVIIVGVGLPALSDENNILKDYFENLYGQGFEYAYTYPGFTKVIQAVGRVIRSDTDRGCAILMDERFTHQLYLHLMPPHWKNVKVINNNYLIKKEIKDFFNKS